MAGKKTAAKSSKQKRPAVPKAPARRPAPRKVAAPSRGAVATASRNSVAASSAKPVARSARSAEREPENSVEGTHSAGHSIPRPVPAFPPPSRPAPIANTAAVDESRAGSASRALPTTDNDESDSVEPG